jgi:hypothetical protein
MLAQLPLAPMALDSDWTGSTAAVTESLLALWLQDGTYAPYLT